MITSRPSRDSSIVVGHNTKYLPWKQSRSWTCTARWTVTPQRLQSIPGSPQVCSHGQYSVAKADTKQNNLLPSKMVTVLINYIIFIPCALASYVDAERTRDRQNSQSTLDIYFLFIIYLFVICLFCFHCITKHLYIKTNTVRPDYNRRGTLQGRPPKNIYWCNKKHNR